MSSQPRKIEIREANEALILQAAEKIFAQNGFKGAATADIAREAGLPKANVQHSRQVSTNVVSIMCRVNIGKLIMAR